MSGTTERGERFSLRNARFVTARYRRKDRTFADDDRLSEDDIVLPLGKRNDARKMLYRESINDVQSSGSWSFCEMASGKVPGKGWPMLSNTKACDLRSLDCA